LALLSANDIISWTFQTALLGIGLGASLLNETVRKPLIINTWDYLAFITVSFLAISIIGIIFSINVYIARPPLDNEEKNRIGIIYFGHIVKYNSVKEYQYKIENMNNDRLLEELTYQVYALSKIANLKMRFVRYSAGCLIINFILTVLLVLENSNMI
jgi:hypothetical protein